MGWEEAHGVGADGGWSSIGNVSLGDDSDLSTGDTTEHLEDGLDLSYQLMQLTEKV